MFRGLLKYFVYFVIFAAIGAGGAYLYSMMTDISRTVKVPYLAGKSITEATDFKWLQNLEP